MVLALVRYAAGATANLTRERSVARPLRLGKAVLDNLGFRILDLGSGLAASSVKFRKAAGKGGVGIVDIRDSRSQIRDQEPGQRVRNLGVAAQRKQGSESELIRPCARSAYPVAGVDSLLDRGKSRRQRAAFGHPLDIGGTVEEKQNQRGQKRKHCASDSKDYRRRAGSPVSREVRRWA
jgi:hypothetical protein